MTIRRTYFVLGEVLRPNGGAHVILDSAMRLAATGRDVAMLYARPNYVYPFAEALENTEWSPRLGSLRIDGIWGLARRVGEISDRVSGRIGRRHCWRRYAPDPGDLLVVPEFRYPEITNAFPDQRIVIMIQDVFGFLNAFSRDMAADGGALMRISGLLSTSEACADLADSLTPGFHGRLLLDLDRESFEFQEKKAFQLAYMPRKREEDAMAFKALMARHCPDVPLVEIDGVSRAEAARLIRESLFFVSLSHREGFGLPPAEAMATGSIVIGYTGVGGNEFFTDETGFPVPEDDILRLVETTRQQIAQYRASPEALDAKRRAASNFVQKKYDKEVATSQLIATWEALEKHLDKERTTDAGPSAALS